jgi:hypothetical protein
VQHDDRKSSPGSSLSSKNLDWNVAVSWNCDIPQQSSARFGHPSRVMADHLHKIAAEVVQLYHKQLSLLVLCNIAGLKVADLIDYARGKERIAQLRRELEGMIKAKRRNA